MKKTQKNILYISEFFTSICMIIYVGYYGSSRAFLSNIKDSLTNDFSLTASNISLLSSAFFFSYSFLQPLGGYLLDRYRLYILLPLFFLMSSLINLFFIKTDSFYILIACRFLLGASFCVTLNGTYKYLAFFPQKYTSGLINLTLVFMYGVGALATSSWIKNMMDSLGWKFFLEPFIKKSFFVVAIMFLVMKIRRKIRSLSEKSTNELSQLSLIKSLKLILNKDYIVMVIFVTCIAPVSPLLMVGWGNDFFEIKFGSEMHSIASMPATLNLIGAASGFIYNIFTYKISTKKQMLLYCVISAFSLFILLTTTNIALFFICCFFIGFVNGGHVIGVTWCQANIDKRCTSLSLGILNFLMMFLGNAVIQNISGIILDFSKSHSKIISSVSKYNYEDFVYMFNFMFIPIFISFLCILLIKKKTKSENKVTKSWEY